MIDLVVVVLLLAFLTWYGHREPSENKTVQLAKPDRNDNHVKPVIQPTSAQTKNDTNTSEDKSDVQNIDICSGLQCWCGLTFEKSTTETSVELVSCHNTDRKYIASLSKLFVVPIFIFTTCLLLFLV